MASLRKDELAELVDGVCDQFEEEWNLGIIPRLTDCLEKLAKEYRQQLLQQLLPLDIELRAKHKLPCSVEFYLSVLPGWATLVRSVFSNLIESHQCSDPDTVSESAHKNTWSPSNFEFSVSENSVTSGINAITGNQIGPYRIVQKIGEGGMGTVWLAQQTEPVRRRVAIKLISVPVEHCQAFARVEAERQAMAAMNHPNIAKFLDAGTTENGDPYFVMEFVAGTPIDEYCDRHQLTIKQRLQLFVAVCKAIQHAHQKGIIHRDIKSTNILVKKGNGTPTVKLIDFGLAKSTLDHVKLTDRTLFTEHGQLLGTLRYMSPEQAAMDVANINVRTDIYSLGVVLYELLTGSTPIDTETVRSNTKLQLLDIIRDFEPPRPSTMFGTSQPETIAICTSRQSSPKQLEAMLRRELDWIVMKALEHDQSRRYATVDKLLDDMQRFLDGQLVNARPPSLRYRARKLVYRHRQAFIATALVLSTLATVATGWYSLNSESARIQAEEALAACEEQQTRSIEAFAGAP